MIWATIGFDCPVTREEVRKIMRELQKKPSPEPYKPDRHEIVEVLGGKFDGCIYDNQASDPVEKFLATWVQHHESYDLIQEIEENGERFLQFRYNGKLPKVVMVYRNW